MRITAQRVVSDSGEQGINALLYRDGVEPWPDDPTVLLEQGQGTLVFQSVELEPGGNRVRSYLDVLVPDSTSRAHVALLLDTLTRWLKPDRLPASGTLGSAAFRLDMELRLTPRWPEEFADLANHAILCVSSYLTAVPQPSPGMAEAGLADLERHLLADAARRSDSAGALNLLRELAATDRLEAMVEGIDVYVAHCTMERNVVRNFFVALMPGILVNNYFPTLGVERFNAFIEWSPHHQEWADWVRQGALESGEALRKATRRVVLA